MPVVVGTAGHIDHGKTTLLRALTGIDADRLPEERRRGMTIDVGYAHLTLDDGRVVDFVDVPGHDRLVGNMLVGAGEIDAVMVVVAADDGPNAQTLEHLELLDALGICDGLAVITKADLVDAAALADLVDAVSALLAGTSLAGVPVLAASAVTGEGIEAVRAALAALAMAFEGRAGERRGARLAIDRAFAVKGRGTVATGSLRGGPVRTGSMLRLVPGGSAVRVREAQARGTTVEAAGPGRTALLLGGVEPGDLARGRVLTDDPAVVATSRLLVAIRPAAVLRPGAPPQPLVADRERLRLHLGTEQVDALVVRGPRESLELPDGARLALLRLDREIAAAPGARFALRRPSPGSTAGGGTVLDADPPRGVSRRRLTPDRAAALLGPDTDASRLALHGAITRPGEEPRLAPDVATALEARAVALVAAHHEAAPDDPGMPLAALRPEVALAARRLVTLGRAAADQVARATVDRLIADGRLARDGDRLRDPARAGGLPPAVREAMDRLERALAVSAPPSLAEAARAAACPPAGVRALEAEGRIVRLEDDLAWAASTYREVAKRALALAAAGPLSPAAFRDATGTSRRYVLVILEDLDRRELLRRTDAGHVLGPKTLARMRAQAAGAAGAPGMNGPERPIVAIVLAGGRSSRFGSDKLAAVVDGEPLLHRALRGVAGVSASDDIVLVIGTDAAVPPLPSGLGACVRVVRDPEAFGGPLVGLRAGLEGLADDAIAVVVAGDMPTLRPAVLRLLAGTLAGDPAAHAALLEHDGPAPLPVALRAGSAREASDAALAAGRRSLRALLGTLQVTRVSAAAWRALDPDADTLRDVDTPADFA